jgi:hypothetical protein
MKKPQATHSPIKHNFNVNNKNLDLSIKAKSSMESDELDEMSMRVSIGWLDR